MFETVLIVEYSEIELACDFQSQFTYNCNRHLRKNEIEGILHVSGIIFGSEWSSYQETVFSSYLWPIPDMTLQHIL